jgi:hypothetical protein
MMGAMTNERVVLAETDAPDAFESDSIEDRSAGAGASE